MCYTDFMDELNFRLRGRELSTKWVRKKSKLEEFLGGLHHCRPDENIKDFNLFRKEIDFDKLKNLNIDFKVMVEEVDALNRFSLDKEEFVKAAHLIFNKHLDKALEVLKDKIKTAVTEVIYSQKK